ncbi:MAG TPA: hypothetical protein VGP30_00380, partial [Candidatus Limnocylindrales bacterium]|nr:hypothetical protein [Candidatus Limnocylindrales bacterium]
MPERPAPLILVTTPPEGQPFGSHTAIAADGQRLLAGILSHRLGRLGAAVAPLPATASAVGEAFHWGRWFTAAARTALAGAGGRIDTIGYVGGGALCLLADDALVSLLSPIPGEVVANNRFSADAVVIAGDLDRALEALEACETDNAAARRLNDVGFAWRDLGVTPWSRFDVDTTLDLALLRLVTRLPETVSRAALDASMRGYLEMARLPGGCALEIPHLARLGEVMRDRRAELVVAGRVPLSTWQTLETETACRVRCLVEERGMRSARDPGSQPRSILAAFMTRSSPAELIDELSRLGDAVVLDTRVLMAAVAGSSDASSWPPEEERFASDFGDHARVATPWLRELTQAANNAPVPILFGGHALVSDGLRLIVAAAWQGW